MKIIYNLIFDPGPEPPSAEGTRRVSALTSRMETEAHRWMLEHYPDVHLDTRRVVNASEQSYILANSPEEQERGGSILLELDAYIGQHKTRWLAEVL